MRVIIPSAGLGSRFLPLSRAVPKELLLLGDRPLIHHALCEAELAGFEGAVIVVSPGKEAIKRYLAPDPELEEELASRGNFEGLARLRSASQLAARMKVEFVEQLEPRGLGDAVLRCAEVMGDETCGVLLPDDVILGGEHWRRLFALHARSSAAAFCLRKVALEETMRFGIAECVNEPDGLRVVRLIEKPRPGASSSNLAVLGRYIVTPPVIAALRAQATSPDRELELADGLTTALGEGETVMGATFTGVHFDCGTPEAYARSVAQVAVSAQPADVLALARPEP